MKLNVPPLISRRTLTVSNKLGLLQVKSLNKAHLTLNSYIFFSVSNFQFCTQSPLSAQMRGISHLQAWNAHMLILNHLALVLANASPRGPSSFEEQKGRRPFPPPPRSVPSSVRRSPCYSPEFGPRLLSCTMRLTAGSRNIKISHFNGFVKIDDEIVIPVSTLSVSLSPSHSWLEFSEWNTESKVICNSSRCFDRTCFTNEFGDLYGGPLTP